METEKLYYQDPYLTAFTARVLSCEKSKSGWAVVLDRTAFYPEGGGQPADHGTLGAVQVTDVHETNASSHQANIPIKPSGRSWACPQISQNAAGVMARAVTSPGRFSVRRSSG